MYTSYLFFIKLKKIIYEITVLPEIFVQGVDQLEARKLKQKISSSILEEIF